MITRRVSAASSGVELSKNGATSVEVLGPSPAPLARLRGKYRYQLLLKAPTRDALRDVARAVRGASTRIPRDVQAVLDIDPVHML